MLSEGCALVGMDLISLDPKPGFEQFHLNWTGWGVLGDLLAEMGCDLSQMSGSNDGDVIDAATTAAWADAIDAAWDSIVCVSYPDASFVAATRTELHVVGTTTPVLVATSVAAREWARIALGTVPDNEDAAVDADVAPLSSPLADNPDEAAWLASVRDYLRNCGGAAQY